MTTFHLSFAVPDLRLAARFYEEVIGCAPGQDAGDWLDLLLFGHQLTLHQATPQHPAHPIDHFGVVLAESQWRALLERLQGAGIDLVAPPRVSDVGTANECGKLLVHDPAGNLLEFKYHAADSQA